MTSHEPKPHAPACERNRDPILAVLQVHFADRATVLEIGSGTGQHAVHFAAGLPHLVWQCSDRGEYLPGVRAWLADAGLANTPEPIELDVARSPWPRRRFDAAFSANTLHIMGWDEVEAMFAGLDDVLDAGATLVVYGPFMRNGAHTAASNEAFDASLRERDPRMGVRALEDVDGLAAGIGLHLHAVVDMPANNLCVVWHRHRKQAHGGH
ncbi:DUF938 domain-containing protein [Alkalisalibacterium limincola]|uniref:DUF938 domain-containing protein n=1 Tax=Alkalisalibacterium limincola TaxID=2699169 RepID=A0A5C8KMA1_9GAMM|nr:DUF938 domain-containing protein [Alkalisalibacterium limincola]TXK60725.1 DUF938 domain-containing protein [Alkalisalibacterium limincola]